MKEFKFTIPFIQPYVRTTQRQKWVDPRYKKYKKAKQIIRALANQAGVPDKLTGTTLVAIEVYWKGKPTCDLDNICKATLDSLWDQDRLVYFINAATWLEASEDRVDVQVKTL